MGLVQIDKACPILIKMDSTKQDFPELVLSSSTGFMLVFRPGFLPDQNYYRLIACLMLVQTKSTNNYTVRIQLMLLQFQVQRC